VARVQRAGEEGTVRYHVEIDGGQLGETDLEADTLEEALDEARLWVEYGEWPDEPGYCEYTVTPSGGDPIDCETIVGTPEEEPDCEDDHDHDWCSPYQVVGGIESNPGVWAGNGTEIRTAEVCRHCGAYRDTRSESTPGQYPRYPERVMYREANEASLAWVRRVP
jgi:hypothetical protein